MNELAGKIVTYSEDETAESRAVKIIAALDTMGAFKVMPALAAEPSEEPGTADGYIAMIQRHVREMESWKVRAAIIGGKE